MPLLTRLRAREHPGVRPRFWLWAGSVVLMAFLVREYFVLATIVDIPIRGDIREYLLYAWNLYHHGVFSMAEPQATAPTGDAFRSPGYPWLLALCMWLRPRGDGWYVLALQMQVALGTATVWLTILLARRWLATGWAIGAGLLLAVWPHHVAATGALLSEITFGFTLMAGMYCFARAMEGRGRFFFVLTAAIFGFSYLVNPLIALFPPLLALLVWRSRGRVTALQFLGVFLLPLLAFAVRNAQLGNTSGKADHVGRVAINLVQGSWPEYHRAWQAQLQHDPGGIEIMRAIDSEARLLNDHPAAGLAVVAERLRTAPIYYARWYVLHKPALLWGWDTQIGPGGVYVVEVRNSPLDTHPLLRLSTAILRTSNPLLTALALVGAMLALVSGLSRPSAAASVGLAVGALGIYLTAVHTVFQAEPRYAIAYRGIELLLVMTAIKLSFDAARRARKTRCTPGTAAPI